MEQLKNGTSCNTCIFTKRCRKSLCYVANISLLKVLTHNNWKFVFAFPVIFMIYFTFNIYDFQNARIVLDKFRVILHSPDSIAPVGVLHPLAFHLESKREVVSISSSGANNQDGLEKMDRVCEVQGDSLPNYMVPCQSIDLASYSGSEEPILCISTSKRDIFSVGCWNRSSSKTLEGKKIYTSIFVI